jgi:tripeptidyl-peptidase-1
MAEVKTAARSSKRSTLNQKKRDVVKRQGTETCAELMTPKCIAALYNIPAADKAHPNNSMGIFEKVSWFQNTDLDLFFATYSPNIPQGTRPLNCTQLP